MNILRNKNLRIVKRPAANILGCGLRCVDDDDIGNGWFYKLTHRVQKDRSATIRTMKRGDVRPVQDVARRTWSDTYKGNIPNEVQDKFLERAYSKTSLERRMTSDVFLVAVLDREIVGFADFQPVSKGGAYLGALYVLPDHQDRGIGRLLLQRGIAAFPPGTEFTLRVENNNERARAFYERYGFEFAGEIVEDLFGFESREIEMTYKEKDE